MRYFSAMILLLAIGLSFPATARETRSSVNNSTLEKQLYALELQWMKAEFDKNMDFMGNVWTDDFFDILYDGSVIDKHAMMDRMAKTVRKPGTGAFPVDFKIRAVYGNVVLATDHTTLKDMDANGKIYAAHELSSLRMFVNEHGSWKIAGAGLVPLVRVASLGISEEAGKTTVRNATLEKLLDDVNNQWLCAGPYHKNRAQDCVDFRKSFWPETFFEISRQGEIMDKNQMVATQTAAAVAHPLLPGDAGPNPAQFKLKAVYGDVALGTDFTTFKAADADGKVSVIDHASVLRIFVKQNGKWRPAGAALIPVISK
jgi:ketosteroid isomerase-like protein